MTLLRRWTESPIFVPGVLCIMVVFFWITASIDGIVDYEKNETPGIREVEIERMQSATVRRQLCVIIPGIIFIGYVVGEHIYKAWYLTGWHGPFECDKNTFILALRNLPSAAWYRILFISSLPVFLASLYASIWALVLFVVFIFVVSLSRRTFSSANRIACNISN